MAGNLFVMGKTPASGKKSDRFPCGQCGAIQKFSPESQNLRCEYCCHENPVTPVYEEIREYDFHRALSELSVAKSAGDVQTPHIQCDVCGAQFEFQQGLHAGECPFCGTPIVTATGAHKPIKPKSLLPFKISEEQAQSQFRRWLKSLWFAPGKLKKYTRGETKLTGVYVPYWTYDSNTETDYVGERGDVYYVNQHVRYMRNGRMVSGVRQVPKIRWTPVRGRVSRFFDNVLIGASLSLPRKITDSLEPWDMDNLQPYQEEYLSGFHSEFYQVDLDEGFGRAQQIMNSTIYKDIAFDIGGDHQRIFQVNTRLGNTTFKHLLLPVWSAAFRYHDQSYRFVVNGRTGKVQGERPLSYWKIGFTVILVGLLAAAVVIGLQQSGVLQNIQYGYY